MSINSELTSAVNELEPVSTTHFPWYAVRTKSNAEKLTSVALKAKGLEQFLPLCRTRRRGYDRMLECDRPLFPGYVFCRFDVRRRLPVLQLSGVVSVVGFGREPAPIPDDEIESIQKAIDSGFPTNPHPFLAEGQRVRVSAGSLRGIEGILVSKKGKLRVVVSVSLLQRSVSVELEESSLIPV